MQWASRRRSRCSFPIEEKLTEALSARHSLSGIAKLCYRRRDHRGVSVSGQEPPRRRREITDNKGRVVDFRNTLIFFTVTGREHRLPVTEYLRETPDGAFYIDDFTPQERREFPLHRLEALREELEQVRIELRRDDGMLDAVVPATDDEIGTHPVARCMEKAVLTDLASVWLSGVWRSGAQVIVSADGIYVV